MGSIDRCEDGGDRLRKAVGVDLLPEGFSFRERFQMAREAGFRAVEMHTVVDPDEAERVRNAAEEAGVHVHSVLVKDGRVPFFAGGAEEIERAVHLTLASLANAARWGSDTLLLIPAVVTKTISHREGYETSQRVIRERILPTASEMRITLGIENVFSGFLQTPGEYLRFIDEFASPWVQPYLDVGNMVFGHPEHWVRECGSRTVRVHAKDYAIDLAKGRFSFAPIGRGGIDWAAVRDAFRAVGYTGYVTNTGIPASTEVRRLDAMHRLLHREWRPAVARGARRLLKARRRAAYQRFLADASACFDRFEALGRRAAGPVASARVGVSPG